MKIQNAIDFAALKHAGQKRKCSNLPYIVHLMEVMYILLSNNCSENIVVAGLLHDTIEDTNTTTDDIKNIFGEDVLNLVLGNTENKQDSWKDRKQHTIDSIKDLSNEQMQVVCADKLSNLSSIYRDIKVIGEKVWNKFNASKDKVIWYYTSISKELNNYMQPNKMLKEFTALCEKL